MIGGLLVEDERARGKRKGLGDCMDEGGLVVCVRVEVWDCGFVELDCSCDVDRTVVPIADLSSLFS